VKWGEPSSTSSYMCTVRGCLTVEAHPGLQHIRREHLLLLVKRLDIDVAARLELPVVVVRHARQLVHHPVRRILAHLLAIDLRARHGALRGDAVEVVLAAVVERLRMQHGHPLLTVGAGRVPLRLHYCTVHRGRHRATATRRGYR